MIVSMLNKNDTYKAYPEAIRNALNYLKEHDMMACELGRYDIAGDDIFVNVMNMTTRAFDGSHPELHRKYIDLMYWPEGGEKIGVAHLQGTENIIEDNPGGDIYFIDEPVDENILTMKAGAFGIFFPWDAHRPGLILGEKPETSRKVVVKIAVSSLDGLREAQ